VGVVLDVQQPVQVNRHRRPMRDHSLKEGHRLLAILSARAEAKAMAAGRIRGSDSGQDGERRGDAGQVDRVVGLVGRDLLTKHEVCDVEELLCPSQPAGGVRPRAARCPAAPVAVP